MPRFNASITLELEAEDIGRANELLRVVEGHLRKALPKNLPPVSVTGSAVGGAGEGCSNCGGSGKVTGAFGDPTNRPTRPDCHGTGEQRRVAS